jgi:hypothetical protein
MPIIGVTGSQNTKGFLQPNPPTIVSATDVGTSRAYNNGAASVAFTPAASGAPATSYTVTSSPGGYTGTGSSSPIVVAGLQSDTAYTFTVTGTNAAGTGQASSASSSVTATTVPQAPTIGAVNATAVGVVTVAYTAGATGGKAVSAFTATSSPSSITGTGSSPISVSGLAQKTAYTFTVTATNANGTSTASSASSSVTTFLATLVDTFDRANGALGTSSDGLSAWTVNRGAFVVDSNMAYSNDNADSMATVTLSTSAISNAQVDMYADQAGVGLAIWATDSASYWGIYPNYTSTTTATSTTTCSGPGHGGTSGNTCATGQNVSGSHGPYYVWIACHQDSQEINRVGPKSTCGVPVGLRNAGNSSCPGEHNGYYSICEFAGGGHNYSTNTNASNVTNTNYATNYTSQLRIKNPSAVVVNNQFASSINPIRSIAVSTSGNVITYRGYSAANKGGSQIVTGTYDAGAGTKGTKVGVFRTAADYLQGGYVNNINVTVV